MADKVKVTMLRGVGGFEEGDTREMSLADAKRLEARGIVKIKAEKATAKAEPAPANKAEKAPANKSSKKA